MDTAQVTTLAATMFGIVTVLVAIFALMWQMNSQNSRLEAKIDTEVGRLEATVDSEVGRLEAKIDTYGRELRDEIRAMSVRVSNSELEQARLNGVNSVLASQTHSHETPGN